MVVIIHACSLLAVGSGRQSGIVIIGDCSGVQEVIAAVAPQGGTSALESECRGRHRKISCLPGKTEREEVTGRTPGKV
jgi:hypothetical protein